MFETDGLPAHLAEHVKVRHSLCNRQALIVVRDIAKMGQTAVQRYSVIAKCISGE